MCARKEKKRERQWARRVRRLCHRCRSSPWKRRVGAKGKRVSPVGGRKVTLIRRRRRGEAASSEGSRWRGEGRNVRREVRWRYLGAGGGRETGFLPTFEHKKSQSHKCLTLIWPCCSCCTFTHLYPCQVYYDRHLTNSFFFFFTFFFFFLLLLFFCMLARVLRCAHIQLQGKGGGEIRDCRDAFVCSCLE